MMATGRVQRIDEDKGCAYIVHRGHAYEAPLAEVETAARVPGARVGYRLQRRKGVETAVDVHLRRGTRTNKRQRRFGDLTGVRRDGNKGVTAGQNAYGIDISTQPLRVAAAWLDAMGQRDDAAASDLYLPGAVVHLADGPQVGRKAMRRVLSRSPWAGVAADSVVVEAHDRYVRAELASEKPPLVTHLLVEDGQIVEQWLDGEPDLDEAANGLGESVDVEVLARGTIDSGALDHARDRVERLLDGVGSGSTAARIKLTAEEVATGKPRARAQLSVETRSGPIRTHATADSMDEAVDIAADRLRSKFEHQHDRNHQTPATATTDAGHWRHGTPVAPRPPFFDRPPAEREIVRHKSFVPDEITVEEAIVDLESLDYEFLLFAESDSGLDCVIAVDEDRVGEFTLQVLGSGRDRGDAIVVADGVHRSPEVAVRLSPSAAMTHLNESGRHYLFFENAGTGRGNVLYHRYDGHYGLITPADVD